MFPIASARFFLLSVTGGEPSRLQNQRGETAEIRDLTKSATSAVT